MTLNDNILMIRRMMGLISEDKKPLDLIESMIECENCTWEWNIKDTEPHDRYVCHKCGYDNSEKYENS